MKETSSLKLENIFWKIVEIIVLILFALMIVAVSYQIACRNFFKFSNSSWTEEVARWCFIWMVFLGSAWAEKRKEHIRVTVIYEKLSFKAKTILTVISDTISLIFLGSIWWGAIKMMKTTDMLFAGSFNVKQSYLYLALLIGIGLIIFLKVKDIFLKNISLRQKGKVN